MRIHELDKYITPQRWDMEMRIVERTGERWVLEISQTVIETLQGLAWMLLAFFVFTLVIYVIIRIFETWKSKRDETKSA